MERIIDLSLKHKDRGDGCAMINENNNGLEIEIFSNFFPPPSLDIPSVQAGYDLWVIAGAVPPFPLSVSLYWEGRSAIIYPHLILKHK